MRTLALALLMILAGCGSDDRFAPGTWEVKGWLESPHAPGAADVQTDTVELREPDAALPPASAFFSRFYHGSRDMDVRFRNGRVEGSFYQPPVDDIAGHRVPVSGTYSRDRFHVAFDFRAFGMTVRQVVEGRLVAPT